jgi:hypothetical protein
MRYQFIQGHQQEFPVRRMCSVLGVSSSGYYAWQNRPVSPRVQANQELIAEIHVIYTRSRKSYGSPSACRIEGVWLSGRQEPGGAADEG